jgi:transcriptional regulator with XRE-family HTH domain
MPKASGQFLYEWRRHSGLTQERVAEEIDKTKGYISELERGVKRYNQDILEALAKLYKCTPADLLSVNPEQDDDRGAAEVIGIYKRIPSTAERDAWIGMGRAITKDQA